MTKRNLFLGVGVLVLLSSVYPAIVLVYTWGCVLRSDFHGGRHGPLDAYRHALASAVVSYTINESAVNLITALFESKGKASNRMDRHNNRIGASLGRRATSFHELEPAVRRLVSKGTVDSADLDQITWLPEEKWRDGWIF